MKHSIIMRNRIIAILSILFTTLSFFACEPDNTLASSDWNGNWRISEDIIFPQTKTNQNSIKTSSGTIKIDPNNERKIIISGELFGLNPSFNISASVVSSNATFDQKVGIYQIKGTAVLNNSNQITFNFTITTENSNTETYNRIAIRI